MNSLKKHILEYLIALVVIFLLVFWFAPLFWVISRKEVNNHDAKLKLNLYHSQSWFIDLDVRAHVNSCYDIWIDGDKTIRMFVYGDFNAVMYSHPWIRVIRDDSIVIRHDVGGFSLRFTIPFNTDSINDKVKIELPWAPDSLQLRSLRRRYKFERL